MKVWGTVIELLWWYNICVVYDFFYENGKQYINIYIYILANVWKIVIILNYRNIFVIESKMTGLYRMQDAIIVRLRSLSENSRGG